MIYEGLKRAHLSYLRLLHTTIRVCGGNAMATINASLLKPRRVERVLAHFGATVANPCEVYGPLIVHNAYTDYSRLTVGRNVHVGRMVFLDLSSEIVIEDDATLSMGVTVLTHLDVGRTPAEHDYARDRYAREIHPTVIGAGSYIGANATILAGCDVGRGAIVAAGAVVTSQVPENVLVAGVPAKLKRRNDEQRSTDAL